MGVDPGGTTGVAIIDVEWDDTRFTPSTDAYVAHYQIEAEWGGPTPIGVHMESIIEDYNPNLIAIENFIITQRTIRYTRQPDALWIIGGVHFLADINGIPVTINPASLAKTTWDAARLKETGWSKKVKGPHAKDALRHALTACVTYKRLV